MDPTLLKLIALTALPTGFASLALFLGLWWKSPDLRTSTPQVLPALSTLSRLLPLLLVTACGIALFPVIHETGFPSFPPARAAGAIPYAALAALLAGLTWIIPSAPIALRWAAALLATAAAAYLSLHNQLATDGGFTKWGSTLIAYSFLAPAGVVGTILLARRTGLATALALTVIAFAASQVFMLGYHSIRHAILAAVLCAVTVGLAVTAIRRPHASLGPAAGLALAVMLATLTLQSAAFGQSNQPWKLAFAALLAASPWAALAATRLPLRREPARALAVIVGAAVPALTAVAIAATLYFGGTESGE